MVMRAKVDWSRLRDRAREFPSFAHFVRAVTAFDFSTALVKPKSFSKYTYRRLLKSTKGAIQNEGVPLRHVHDWLEGRNKLKVSGNLHSRSRLTLVYLDVDCHGRGSPKDAERLCRLLADRLPHGQPLTSERGASAWVVVDPADSRPTSQAYNALIDRIQTYVRGVAAANALDLSGVEVLGRVTVWGTDDIRCADMLKCPKGWENIGPVVPYRELAETDWTPPVAPPKAKARLRAGSSRFVPPPAVAVNGLDHLVGLVREWFPDRPVRTGNNRLITDERFAEVLLVMAHLRQNKDGSMPHAYAKSVWQQWFAEGMLQHGWVSEVWQTVRDYLSAGGFLDAEEGGGFVPPVRDHNGIVVARGQAAKWCMSDWMRATVRATAEGVSLFAEESVVGGQSVGEAEVGVVVLGTYTQAGGGLVHTSYPLPSARRSKPWRVHAVSGIRPLSLIPRRDWDRLDKLLAA